jgi:hypothetical protein
MAPSRSPRAARNLRSLAVSLGRLAWRLTTAIAAIATMVTTGGGWPR